MTNDLSKNDTDHLSAFVRAYCDTHAIECDGDVFGLLFDGAVETEWTEAEAAKIIEDAADAYGLRLPKTV